MKYALIFLFTLISFFHMEKASARTITKFRDSEALLSMAQFMYDATEDIPVSLRLSDKKLNIKDFTNCTNVSFDVVLKDAEVSIKRVLRYYPDEELPFEQAMIDLEDYLDQRSFKQCKIEKKTSQARIITTYYTDSSDKIHLRLDNMHLTAE